MRLHQSRRVRRQHELQHGQRLRGDEQAGGGPEEASMTLSVSSWRAMRRGDAPIAVRTPISRWRAAARDRLRFATLAQAMTSTSATAAIRISSRGRTPPTSAS